MAPIIEIQQVIKSYQSLRPLRLQQLSISSSDRLALRGFDAGAAEMFVHLVTGASLPEEGAIRVGGRDTRDITTDTEWLTSLDRFGIVTHRAVLIDQLTVDANLALPMTVSIDPMSAEIRQRVESLAADAGFAASVLGRKVGELGDEDRLRLHLARAVANAPEMLMLEHATARLTDPAASARIGETLRRMADARGFGWIALTEDDAFVRSSGATMLALEPATGVIAAPKRGWRRWVPGQ